MVLLFMPQLIRVHGKIRMILLKSLLPTSHFFCKVCNKDVSITHQGARDIERHAEGKMHQQRVKSGRNQSRLNFGTTSDSDSNKVTAAEVRNTVMIAHHNAALCLADHIGPMQRKNF